MKTPTIIGKPSLELLVLAILVFEFAFPQHVASATIEQVAVSPSKVVIAAYGEGDIEQIKPENRFISLSVPRRVYKPVASYFIPVTSYSSTPDQTDSTPCITANGFDLCAHDQEDVIAANFLPFGTKVRFPELFGDRVFTVQDRMNARYYYRADVWMRSREAATKFGIAYTTIEVVE